MFINGAFDQAINLIITKARFNCRHEPVKDHVSNGGRCTYLLNFLVTFYRPYLLEYVVSFYQLFSEEVVKAQVHRNGNTTNTDNADFITPVKTGKLLGCLL